MAMTREAAEECFQNCDDKKQIICFLNIEKKDIFCILLPTFEDVCLNEEGPHVFKYVTSTSEDLYITVDVRYLYNKDFVFEKISEVFVNPYYEDIFNKFASKPNKINKENIKTIYLEVMKKAYLTPTITKQEFFDHLTVLEKKAYSEVVSTVRAEGTLVISQMVNKTGISRPVFNNLFAKMKQYDVAIVNNRGVKGTYIQITHPELKEDALR